jgi:hypothetical protein
MEILYHVQNWESPYPGGSIPESSQATSPRALGRPLARGLSTRRLNTRGTNMSHFYGTIPESARKTVPSARGHKATGLTTVAASWDGAIRVNLWHDPNNEVDCYEVEMIPWEGQGNQHVVARGVLGDVSQCKAYIKKISPDSTASREAIPLIQQVVD